MPFCFDDHGTRVARSDSPEVHGCIQAHDMGYGTVSFTFHSKALGWFGFGIFVGERDDNQEAHSDLCIIKGNVETANHQVHSCLLKNSTLTRNPYTVWNQVSLNGTVPSWASISATVERPLECATSKIRLGRHLHIPNKFVYTWSNEASVTEGFPIDPLVFHVVSGEIGQSQNNFSSIGLLPLCLFLLICICTFLMTLHCFKVLKQRATGMAVADTSYTKVGEINEVA